LKNEYLKFPVLIGTKWLVYKSTV